MLAGLGSIIVAPLAYFSSTSQADLSSSSTTPKGLVELHSQSPYFAGLWMTLAAYELLSMVGFLALYLALRKTSPAAALLAAVMSFVAFTIDLAGDISVRLSLIEMSTGYVNAVSDAQRAAYATSAELAMTTSGVAAFVMGVPYGLGLIMISYAMLKSEQFNKITAYLGMAGGVLIWATIPLWGFPTAILAVGVASAVPILLWSILSGYKLYRLT